ncbi:winged helix-turn-helix transcriptional regulator [Amycolatopsis keratiniphila]|uniref:HxlR family transcriptional regulator n=1 Tax=Amycolatopsis keratiniphila TaxID=129921 RepID=R4SUM2_9PSEU|nr:helix-turn-helix domain-containing protein [Amycolatopsis keratiniphila]AGM07074.1 HxlR family transcriptional regulator [Amycolatopsis keratiniphila]
MARRRIVLAEGMGGENVSYQQRVNDAVSILRGQWTISVLAALALGELPYKELLTAVNTAEHRPGGRAPLSDRVFTDTLKRAQGHSLIDKRTDPQRSGVSVYELTPKGRALLRAVRPLVEWAQEHEDQDDHDAVRVD